MNPEHYNARLASACQQQQAACCKKGWLFLSPAEREVMERHVTGQGPAEVAEFAARLQAHEGFSLYDQRDRCQFLTDGNLCSLHPLGIKPNECFWWPYHVYAHADGRLMIEISTTCCEACHYHDETAAAGFLDAIDEQVAGLGPELIHRFRAAYGGSYGRRPVRRVRALTFRFLTAEDPGAGRELAERLWPEANTASGRERLPALLAVFHEGILGAWLGERLVGFASLWPVQPDFEAQLKLGRARADDLNESHLARADTCGGDAAWFLSAIAVDPNNLQLRRRVRRRLEEHILGKLRDVPGARVSAEAVTPAGERFLRRLGFRFEYPAAPRVGTLRH